MHDFPPLNDSPFSHHMRRKILCSIGRLPENAMEFPKGGGFTRGMYSFTRDLTWVTRDSSSFTREGASFGQRQRAWIAMTLAQDTDIILLDEPTTYLDLTHQIEVLDLLFKLNHQQNRTIIMVLHAINLACRYADHIITVRY